ncbi:hypothetical protein [Thermococcus sp. AM4]|uniref:hypothetical protein n=1 Tax=Thermococcus sp. (strain AM4) TaxID=246969 RepID=UPI000187042F|nr:hypothetical protein [Thermococcus sp. AM4]EEB74501.1 hypothetical protein TAM4_446 [Thermococcus sp. AM4]
MRRFILTAVLALLLSSIAPMLAYPLKSGVEINTFPTPIGSLRSGHYEALELYVPGWMAANMTCSGGTGTMRIADQALNKTLLEVPIDGQLTAEFAFPHAGIYEITFNGSGTPTCALVMRNVHAPLGTQRFYYSLGVASSLLLSALLLRGWRW